MLLLQHLDDIDDIVDACSRRAARKPITREAFRALVAEALHGRPMTRPNVDFLFQARARRAGGLGGVGGVEAARRSWCEDKGGGGGQQLSAPPPAPRRPQCFDTNGDGVVSSSELVRVLSDFKAKADKRYEVAGTLSPSVL